MSRGLFWLLVIANVVVAEAIQQGIAAATLRSSGPDHISLPLTADPKITALFYAPALIAASWRLHDTGRSGALAWLVFVLKVGIVYLLTGLAFALSPFLKTASGTSIMATSISGSLGITLFVGVLMLRLAYLCAQPSDSNTNRFGPQSGSPDAPDDLGPDIAISDGPMLEAAPKIRAPMQRASTATGKPVFGRRT